MTPEKLVEKMAEASFNKMKIEINEESMTWEKLKTIDQIMFKANAKAQLEVVFKEIQDGGIVGSEMGHWIQPEYHKFMEDVE